MVVFLLRTVFYLDGDLEGLVLGGGGREGGWSLELRGGFAGLLNALFYLLHVI